MDEQLKRIAGRIRGWRHEAGSTLQQLGDRSGVSASTIHKIENLQTVPTIVVLLKVAHGFNRRPSELLEDLEDCKPIAVQRSVDRQMMTFEGRAGLEHLSAMIPRNRLDYWRAELKPNAGAGTDGEAWRFNGELNLFVEAGELECDIGGDAYELGVGDSIHLDSSIFHCFSASGGQPATVLVLALLPERLQGNLMSRIAMAAQDGRSRIEATPAT